MTFSLPVPSVYTLMNELMPPCPSLPMSSLPPCHYYEKPNAKLVSDWLWRIATGRRRNPIGHPLTQMARAGVYVRRRK
ncbi:hypothetical protein E2C01_101088 [Portunus trituberculatus]|uniref:Uncharacterized protein n=1 Tax=Portunus trituberculatus TaxID=210409 RepID=A0A5B7KJM1_PORTR|nr:hypothetical protein [Portunus trituberculatus]